MATGPTSGDIVYQPQPKPGAIALDAFVQLAKHPQVDVVLVDLRGPIEVEEPTINHVVNIPFRHSAGAYGSVDERANARILLSHRCTRQNGAKPGQ